MIIHIKAYRSLSTAVNFSKSFQIELPYCLQAHDILGVFYQINIWCPTVVMVVVCNIMPCSGIILCICPANERWYYNVTSSFIGWAHSQNDPWCWAMLWWRNNMEMLITEATMCVWCFLCYYPEQIVELSHGEILKKKCQPTVLAEMSEDLTSTKCLLKCIIWEMWITLQIPGNMSNFCCNSWLEVNFHCD